MSRYSRSTRADVIAEMTAIIRRAMARARRRYAATHPDRPRLRRMHTAYRARTRGRSRRG